MQWVERFGKYIALALLAFMWPVVNAYQRSVLPTGSTATFALSAGTYAGVYGWYCLWGHRSQDKAASVGTVLALTVLALVLEHLGGEPDFNFFLIPLAVAGFAFVPRVALIAIAFVAAASILDAALLDSRPAGSVAIQLALLLPSLSLFGAGAIALRYLLNTLAELRAARAEIAQQAADRERLRIARDLHDLLGHNLSLITLKGELATRLISGSPDIDVDQFRCGMGVGG